MLVSLNVICESVVLALFVCMYGMVWYVVCGGFIKYEIIM